MHKHSLLSGFPVARIVASSFLGPVSWQPGALGVTAVEQGVKGVVA